MIGCMRFVGWAEAQLASVGPTFGRLIARNGGPPVASDLRPTLLDCLPRRSGLVPEAERSERKTNASLRSASSAPLRSFTPPRRCPLF